MSKQSETLKQTNSELARKLEREDARLAAAQARERTSSTRGLLLLALAVLVLVAAIAGHGRVFYPGWWRQW